MTLFRIHRPMGLFLLGALALPAAILFSGPAFAEDAPGTETTETAEATEAVEIPWVMDFSKAQAQAKAEGKDLLINFTGSDWCGWCTKLEGEVFHHKEFLDVALKNYVMVFLDFPRAEELKAKVVDAKLNEKLQGEYGVGGFPSIILTNAKGEPYGKTGYQAGGPEGYLKHLEEIRDDNKGLIDLVSAGEKASADQLKAGMKVMLDSGLMSYPSYSWIVDRAKTADPAEWLGAKKIFLAAEAEQKLKAMLPASRETEPDWEKIGAFIASDEHLSGNMFVQLGFGSAKYLLEKADKPAEAKKILQAIMRDDIYKQNPGAKKAIDDLIVRCEESIEMNKEEATDEAK